MLQLMHGTGMRVMECARLRVLDLDFAYRQILVRAGKGNKDRAVPMPQRTMSALREQVQHIRQLHQRDLAAGFGRVFLPTALARKYPNAEREFRWHYVFPATRLAQDPRSGVVRRHHLHQSVLQREIKAAAIRAGIDKHAQALIPRFAIVFRVGGSGCVQCALFQLSVSDHLVAVAGQVRLTTESIVGHHSLNLKMPVAGNAEASLLGIALGQDQRATEAAVVTDKFDEGATLSEPRSRIVAVQHYTIVEHQIG